MAVTDLNLQELALFNSAYWPWVILHAFLSSTDLVQINFFKKFFLEYLLIRGPNRFDPGQARHIVGPDLGPNCLQSLSADDLQNSRIWTRKNQNC